MGGIQRMLKYVTHMSIVQSSSTFTLHRNAPYKAMIYFMGRPGQYECKLRSSSVLVQVLVLHRDC